MFPPQGSACKIICNQQFTELFSSAEELYMRMHGEGISPALVYARSAWR
jgi:hypothetical protein